MTTRDADAPTFDAAASGSTEQSIENLAEDVLRALEEVGFCVVTSVLPHDAVAEMRELVELLLHAEPQNRHHTGHQRVLHLAAKHAAFHRALLDPLALAVWRRFLSPDVICSTFTANALWPGATEFYWHADHPYWTLTPPWPSMPLTGQNIWFLDEFTIENGATAGIPGSHRRGALPPYEDRSVEGSMVLTGPPGSVIFAHGAWWHTSRPNTTDALRCALLATYTHTFCVPQEEMRLQLDAIDEPGDALRRILGGDQYRPQRNFPY
ncbi:MAG: phytanoyl-CoA dioxygenase family protein [Egibacteraceae bacterium]